MSSALLILERNEKILSLLYQDNRLVQVKVHEDNLNKQNNRTGEDKSSSLPLHAIYIGKVKNVVPSIDAVFVEVEKGKMGFLPMKQAKNPIIVNRKYDGRIVAGDEILVQIEKEGIKTKEPGLTCNLSFTGKYCVLTTGKLGVGFSSKLDKNTKTYLKEILDNWKIEELLQEEKVNAEYAVAHAADEIAGRLEVLEDEYIRERAADMKDVSHRLVSILSDKSSKRIVTEKKEELFSQYGKSNKDTGSAESQIALFSYRISHLTGHLKANRKDFATQRALTKLVGKRRQLLDYLKDRDIERYRTIIKALGLRK